MYWFSEEGLIQESKRHRMNALQDHYYAFNNNPLDFGMQSIFHEISQVYHQHRMASWFINADAFASFELQTASEKRELLTLVHQELIGHKISLQKQWINEFTPIIQAWQNALIPMLQSLIPDDQWLRLVMPNGAVVVSPRYIDDQSTAVLDRASLIQMSEWSLDEMTSLNYHMQLMNNPHLTDEFVMNTQAKRMIEAKAKESFMQILHQNNRKYWSTYEPGAHELTPYSSISISSFMKRLFGKGNLV